MAGFEITRTPEERLAENENLLASVGLGGIIEKGNDCYVSLSLTNTPATEQKIVVSRQGYLVQGIENAGIHTYDPGSSKEYSPDKSLNAPPDVIFGYDGARVAAARFFSGNLLFPSQGQGVERGLAFLLRKLVVMCVDENIRDSRMMPGAIYLAYSDLEKQIESISEVFRMLKEYKLGAGIKPSNIDGPIKKLAVLVGFGKGSPVDLAHVVYTEFPKLRFQYDEHKPIITLQTANPQIFYENR